MPNDDFQISLSADISDLTSKMDEAKESVGSMSEEMASAGEKGGEGLSEGMEGAGEAMGEFKEKADGMVENLGKMTEGWTGLLAVLGGGAVAEVMEKIAETTMEVGDAMRNTSAALNVSV